jgi:hypothetical protein
MSSEVTTVAIAFLTIAAVIYLLSEWAIWQPAPARRSMKERTG